MTKDLSSNAILHVSIDCNKSCEHFWYLARHGTSTWCKKQQETSEASEAADGDEGDCCLDAILMSCG